MAYESVNGAWPAGTNEGRALKPNPQEAVTAVKRLWRFAMKRPCPLKVVAVAGRRLSGITSGVYHINPDERGGGWHEVVHDVSHRCAWRLHPGVKTHSTQHAFLEREMIAYAVRSGWLDGKLRRPERPAKPKPNPAEVRYQRVLAAIARWEAKRRRAVNALKRLERRRRHYERRRRPD